MQLFALGLNHHTTPLAIREKVAFRPERLVEALGDFVQRKPVKEAAILSTCNRTEVYCDSASAEAEQVCAWLSHWHAIPAQELRPYLYVHPGQEAVRHMLRVASGLDSLVLGEPQILGQVKDAYQSAADAGTLDGELDRLFQHTFAVAKQVRRA